MAVVFRVDRLHLHSLITALGLLATCASTETENENVKVSLILPDQGVWGHALTLIPQLRIRCTNDVLILSAMSRIIRT
jgi:hypothetical protein